MQRQATSACNLVKRMKNQEKKANDQRDSGRIVLTGAGKGRGRAGKGRGKGRSKSGSAGSGDPHGSAESGHPLLVTLNNMIAQLPHRTI
eukprot:7452425-Karenia_brevis.AAC.1